MLVSLLSQNTQTEQKEAFPLRGLKIEHFQHLTKEAINKCMFVKWDIHGNKYHVFVCSN